MHARARPFVSVDGFSRWAGKPIALPMNLPVSRPSSTLAPRRERDGVRVPLAVSGAQCEHKVRRIFSVFQLRLFLCR